MDSWLTLLFFAAFLSISHAQSADQDGQESENKLEELMFRQAHDLASMMMDVKTLITISLRQDDLAPVMTSASQQEDKLSDIESRLKTFETRIENIEAHTESILMHLVKGNVVQKYNKFNVTQCSRISIVLPY